MEKNSDLKNITHVQVEVSFGEDEAQVVPLTPLQAGILFRTLGFRVNEETGLLDHFTDKELAGIFRLR